MKIGNKSKALSVPLQFNLQKLMNGLCELSFTENVTIVKVHNEISGTPYTEYEYTEFRAVAQVNGYETAVAAFVALKYTYADEFALMRKGMNDSQNAEYLAYVDYVEACKAYAATRFEKE